MTRKQMSSWLFVFVAVGGMVLLLLMMADVAQERAERLAEAAELEIPPDVDTASGWKIGEYGASSEAVLSGAHLMLMVICVEGWLDGVSLEPSNQFDPGFEDGVVDLWFDDGEAEIAVWSGGLVPPPMYRRMLVWGRRAGSIRRA